VFLLVFVAAIFGTVRCLALNETNLAGSQPKRVLMLFSEAKDVPGNIMLEQAVKAEMLKASTNPVVFSSEYLDASHFSGKEHFRVFQNYIGKKYTANDLDLVLAFPSQDYTLAGELPDALFPAVPVVFVAINEMDAPLEISKLGVTGIVQRFDIRGTLGLIKRLQPDTRRVVVIGGSTPTDRATLGRIAEASQSLEGVQFEFWTNRPVAELPGLVRSLPEGTVILLGSILRDVTGQTYYTPQVAQLLAPQASVPVYVLGGWSLGTGALGGSVVDPEDLGARAGQLALRVLAGADPENIPIDVATKGTPMVDWRAIKRLGIKESRVPAGTVIRFRPETLWDEHRDLILILLAVFLAQAATITGLLVQRRERLRAEAEIMNQRTELAHVTRVSTMGQLTSTLAHELNQPLGAILRNAEAAEIFLQKENPDLEEIRAILADIRKDDRRAGHVISRMRSLLKRRSLELKSLDIAELLEEAISMAQPDARARRVFLALQLREKLPAVRGDRVHLQQVLLNLILNGMDSMAGVAASQRLLTVSAKTTGGKTVEVSVSDTGAGIAPDKIERLFEPFFTTKPNGMGMGLAISQTIIEAHGGKIWGGNNETRGAVFFFTLPVDDK
jgi:signal transduction histidine kinase